MKVEDTVFVLASEIHGELIYLTYDRSDGYDYSFNIRCAMKATNKVTALSIKDDYEDDLGRKSDLKIISLKITYEW